MFNTFKKTGSLTALLFVLSWTTAAHSAVIGIAVDDVGSFNTTGIQDADGQVTYFIPLAERRAGVYGDGSRGRGRNQGIGTRADRGDGYGYADASALTMNLYFDLSDLSNLDGATLDIDFDDLDLRGINDPDWFFESVSLTAINGATETDLGFYTHADDLGATSDPFVWSLDLAALGTLDNDFWIQLGFGSDTSGNRARNTAEYLSASISAVPVPAAFWLFGTALIGFIGVSRRTKIS